jgi:hypothetical protein
VGEGGRDGPVRHCVCVCMRLDALVLVPVQERKVDG